MGLIIIGCIILVGLFLVDDILASIKNLQIEEIYRSEHGTKFKSKSSGLIQTIISYFYHKRASKKQTIATSSKIETKHSSTHLQSRLDAARTFHKYYGDLGENLDKYRLRTAEQFFRYIQMNANIYDINMHQFKKVASINRINKTTIIMTFDDLSSTAFIPERYAMIPTVFD